MIEENAAATNNQDITYNPLFLEEDNSIKQPKREIGNPLGLLHGLPLETSSAEVIQGHASLEPIASTFRPEGNTEPPNFLLTQRFKMAAIGLDRLRTEVNSQFPKVVVVHWVDSGAFQPSFCEAESPTTDAGQEHPNPSAMLYSHMHWILGQSVLMSPWSVRNAFQLRWSEAEFPTATPKLSNLDKNATWAEILERFDIIAQREDNWDGYESKSPNKLSLDNARQFMNKFVDAIVSAGEMPLTPSLISSDEDGHITVVWHGAERQLHLQIEENEVDYIQVWGPNIDTEMHVDTLHSKDYRTLWKWLLYG